MTGMASHAGDAAPVVANTSDSAEPFSMGSVLNALPDPVVVIGGADDILYLNPAGEMFFAGSVQSLKGADLQELIPHDSPLLSLISRVRRAGHSMTEHGVRISTPRIGEHSVSIDAAPLTDLPNGVVLTLSPNSIAGKIDDAILQRGAVRSITALSSMLAHEVKNPLSGIRGAAQLLESMVGPEVRELTRLITEETDRIVKLVDRMEVFSDSPILEREPVNIHQVLNRVVAIARNGFAKDVRITEIYDPSLPPVYGDRDQLIQIFLNLVKNASEAVPKGSGEIVLSTAFRHGVRLAVPGGGMRVQLPLVVTVTDNGPGIPEDIRAHLFDAFVSTKPAGTGLGLALVAKLVGDHGGVVDVDSIPRRTVFRVMLPMMRGDE